MMIRWIKYIGISLLLFSGSQAQETKYGGAFLELGIGPRPLALGSAYVALADDGSGFYWNPAGTAFLNSLNVAMMYANLFNSLENHGYVSVAMPIFGNAVVSASWIRLAVEDIPEYYDPDLLKERDERYLDPEGSGLKDGPSRNFTFANNAYFITFSRIHHWKADLGWQYFELPIDFAYGLNFKMIDIGLDNKSGSGLGVDAGVRFATGLNDLFADENFGLLSLGVSMQDIFKTAITWDTYSKQKDRIESAWRFGFAYNQPLLFIDSEILFAYDIYTKYEGSWHLGSEFVYNKLMALRFGFYDGNFTTGAGISYWKLNVDYAYQSHDLGNSHRVGIAFHF